ncbi:hypothetical protein L596_004522 [Steinernema carpocapsae]|uniref:Uncharacterized protein n=1 Tax=Steinernema carpocapsae TaxID=34508 RepID=A0A4U8V072_STECR|nr:hypothetical protein L596_004522 [Steinernema carpocapsae]
MDEEILHGRRLRKRREPAPSPCVLEINDAGLFHFHSLNCPNMHTYKPKTDVRSQSIIFPGLTSRIIRAFSVPDLFSPVAFCSLDRKA